MRNNNLHIFKVRRLALSVLVIFMSFGSVLADVPAGRVCEQSSGIDPEYMGSGVCSGNNFLSFDLSYIYPNMALYYNSTYAHDYLGLGKNFTLGDVTLLNLSSAKQFYITGEATFIPLEYRTSGTWRGAYLAKNRSLVSDYFTNPTSDVAWQYAMNGDTYKYVKVPWAESLYRLSAIISRTGVRSEIFVGEGLPVEYLKFGEDRISISRSAKNITFTNPKDSSKWVTLVRDYANRLVRIRYAEESMYEFKYDGSSTRIISSKLSSKEGSEETRYLYDSSGLLIGKGFSNGTWVRYGRNKRRNVVKGIYPNGQIQEEKFDSDGHITSSKTYLIGKVDVPLEEVEYSYDVDGKLLSYSSPEGEDQIKYVPKYYLQDKRMPVGYQKFRNGTLIEEVDQTRNLDTWLSVKDTLKGEGGQILSQTQYVYPDQKPFLVKSKIVLEGPDKGEREDYIYEGARTTVNAFNKEGTKISTEVYNGELPVETVDFTSPVSNQKKEYEFDSEKRLVSIKVGGAEVVRYAYDGEGRVTFYKDKKGAEHSTFYDAKGYVEREEHKYAGGVSSVVYSREFFDEAGEKVKFLNETVSYPKETRTKRTEYGVDGKVVKVWVNGVEVR